MNIGFWGIVIGVLLILIPLSVFYYFSPKLLRSTARGVLLMVFQLLFIGIYLKYLFIYNKVWINIIWLLLMAVITSFGIVRKNQRTLRRYAFALTASIFVTSLLLTLFLTWFVLRSERVFDARFFIPVGGLLLGGMLTANSAALKAFHDNLTANAQLFYYLTSNGANRLEAFTPFIRRALEETYSPLTANMTVIALFSLPTLLLGQILGGIQPLQAVMVVIALLIATLSSTVVSFLLTLLLSHRRLTNDHCHLDIGQIA